ncbi:hypothetical protein ACXR2U_04810 [Jatrophihabitans sp. YIM 134969]
MTDDAIRSALRRLVGVEIAGGCDDCPATTHLAEEKPGVFMGHVGHQPTCPTWQRIKAGASS